MYCMQCGEPLPDDAKFCNRCGTPVDSSKTEEGVPTPRKLEEPLSVGAVAPVPITPTTRTNNAARLRIARNSARNDRTKNMVPKQNESSGWSSVSNAGTAAGASEQVPVQKAPADTDSTTKIDSGSVMARMRGSFSGSKTGQSARVNTEKIPDPEQESPTPGQEPVSTVSYDAVSGHAREFGEESENDGSPSSFFARLKGDSHLQMTAIALLIAAIGVVALVAISTTSWFGPLGGSSSSDDSSVVATDEGSDDTSSETVVADDETEAGETGSSGAVVRAAVEEYSWSELSQISALISAASSDDEAIQIAIEYNLCNDDGTLDGTQTKELELTDGTTVTMRVAGFNQDEKSDGSGTAGITFIAEDSVGSMAMTTDLTSYGWADSELRTWLNGDLLAELPDELQSLVVAVDKTTNPVAGSDVTEQVTTSDSVWLLSYSEIVGELTTDNKRYDYYTSEGEQYQLFSDVGVEWHSTNEILSLYTGEECWWWMRSPDVLSSEHFLCVYYDGSAYHYHRAPSSNEVIIGFCI